MKWPVLDDQLPMTAEWVATPPTMPQPWPAALTPWLISVLAQRPSPDIPALPAKDWQLWQRAMDSQGLLPLLYHWLKVRPDSVRPPNAIMIALQQAYLQQTAMVAIRHSQLLHLLKLMAKAALQPLVLKGTAVAATLYPDPALRPAADIDLLVPRDSYEQARQALLAAGYRSRKGRGPGQADWAGEEEFVVPGEPNNFMIDLHWSLTPFTWTEPLETSQRLLARARSVRIGDRDILILAPPDALAHAALHLCYANFDNVRLLWLHDIHLLASQIEDQGGWQEVYEAAAQMQARLALVDALLLAAKWYGTNLPPGLADLTQNPPHVAEWEVYRIVHSPADSREKLQQLRVAGLNRSQRLRFYRDRLMPNSQEIDLNYPRFRRWPYPLKVVGRLSTILFDRSNGD